MQDSHDFDGTITHAVEDQVIRKLCDYPKAQMAEPRFELAHFRLG